jgi:hypothetical protein
MMAKKKTEEQKLAEEMKKMEAEKRKEVEIKADAEVSFDSWFAQRTHKIPKIHKKEIIFADFKARGLGKKAKMEEYDKALALYGLKL